MKLLPAYITLLHCLLMLHACRTAVARPEIFSRQTKMCACCSSLTRLQRLSLDLHDIYYPLPPTPLTKFFFINELAASQSFAVNLTDPFVNIFTENNPFSFKVHPFTLHVPFLYCGLFLESFDFSSSRPQCGLSGYCFGLFGPYVSCSHQPQPWATPTTS